MEELKRAVAVPGNRKLKKILLILMPILISAFIIFFFLRKMITIGPALLTWLFILIGTFISVILSRKFYNWIFVFLVIILTALYFRSFRMPPWHLLLVIGFSGIACISFYSAFNFLVKYNHNKFLKFIGFSSGIILTTIFIGQLWKMMHWALAGILQTVGIILFTPYLFAFILLLPVSDYVNWRKPDRIIFFRVVIIPMIFIYSLIIIMYAVPGIWALLRTPITPFGMFALELLDKPGI